MVLETWVLDVGSMGSGTSLLRLFRVFRLARVTRASRLVKAFPELLLIVHGIIAGMRAVIAVLFLLLLLIYVFSILFTLTLHNTGVVGGVFDHLLSAMNHLLIQVLCGPDPDFMNSLLAYHWTYYMLFIV